MCSVGDNAQNHFIDGVKQSGKQWYESEVLKSTSLSYHCSDWLITKNTNIQNPLWAKVAKLGMFVVVNTDISPTHVVCCQQMCIMYLSNMNIPLIPHICSDWLITKKLFYGKIMFWRPS